VIERLPDENLFLLNGVDGSTGDYLVNALKVQEVLELLAASTDPSLGGQHHSDLSRRADRERSGEIALSYGLDPRQLAHSGWGVIFATDGDPVVRDALKPLLELRKAQATAGGQTQYYREFHGPSGYRPGESKYEFLLPHGVLPGNLADPAQLPYYLLLVGDPERIPFRFQYELDVEYAVGRVWFQTPDAYARYANSVVVTETRLLPLPRRAVFFGAHNAGDFTT
jgi:hypothetical protein